VIVVVTISILVHTECMQAFSPAAAKTRRRQNRPFPDGLMPP